MVGKFVGICRLPVLLSLCGLLFCAAAIAGDRQVDYPRVAAQQGFDAVLALPVGSPEAVYRYGEAKQQFAELWLPDGDVAAPVVIFIHGGCWLNQFDIGHSHPAATALTQLGFAVWNIEYRRAGDPGGGWPGSLDDVVLALALLEELRPAGVDLQRAALAGHSAGGHLALLAAGKAEAGLADARLTQSVLGLAPIVDIVEYAQGQGSCNLGALEFMGGSPEELTHHYAAANPAREPLPPGTAILKGSEDRIVPLGEPPPGVRLWVRVDGAGHFDWIHPGTSAWRRLVLELQQELM